jgi:methionine synthase II (cobalamin-independent)
VTGIAELIRVRVSNFADVVMPADGMTNIDRAEVYAGLADMLHDLADQFEDRAIQLDEAAWNETQRELKGGRVH